MTRRERVMATIHKKHADRIPFQIATHWLKQGQLEREARNIGMGVNWALPCMHTTMPHVNVITLSEPRTSKRSVTRTTYETPVGTVWQSRLNVKPFGGAYDGIGAVLTEYLVKKTEDRHVLKYMAQDIEAEPYYERFDYFKRLLGEDGVVIALMGPTIHSPYPKLLIDWAGATRLYIDHFKHPEKVESVLEAMAQSQEKRYPILVNAPADIIVYGDHIDNTLISPKAFEKYILPTHNKFAQIAHAQGKITSIHCDGKLDGLKELIAGLEHDIIQAVTPPPVGNLPIKEALDLWEDKIIEINYEYHFMGPKALKKHLLNLLRSIIPGYRVIIDASTERWVPPDCLKMSANIMSKATLPLTNQRIDRIAKST